jgi:hypothetical protein
MRYIVAMLLALGLTAAQADEIELAEGEVCPVASLFGCWEPIWEYRTLGGGDNGPAASSGPGEAAPAAGAPEGGDDGDEGGEESDDKPGYGYGDNNHNHSGPPGQDGNNGGNGDNSP